MDNRGLFYKDFLALWLHGCQIAQTVAEQCKEDGLGVAFVFFHIFQNLAGLIPV